MKLKSGYTIESLDDLDAALQHVESWLRERRDVMHTQMLDDGLPEPVIRDLLGEQHRRDDRFIGETCRSMRAEWTKFVAAGIH
jgi:hypothetical protein